MTASLDVREVDTPEGLARIHISHGPAEPHGTLVLGHGAGGRDWSADLLALTGVGGWRVVLVEQPWRVAGRKVATPPPRLDTAWSAVVTTLVETRVASGRVVLGGRSAGARVACRTASALAGELRAGGAELSGILALAFPLHPPGKPEKSRADELAAPLQAGTPTLVVQGRGDPFGTGAEVRAAVSGSSPVIVEVDGGHSFAPAVTSTVSSAVRTAGVQGLTGIVGDWLGAL